MNTIETVVIKRKMRDAVKFNSDIVREKADELTSAIERLKVLAEDRSIAGMQSELKDIVRLAIECRARVQFMHGLWSFGSEISSPIQNT